MYFQILKRYKFNRDPMFMPNSIENIRFLYNGRYLDNYNKINYYMHDYDTLFTNFFMKLKKKVKNIVNLTFF